MIGLEPDLEIALERARGDDLVLEHQIEVVSRSDLEITIRLEADFRGDQIRPRGPRD